MTSRTPVFYTSLQLPAQHTASATASNVADAVAATSTAVKVSALARIREHVRGAHHCTQQAAPRRIPRENDNAEDDDDDGGSIEHDDVDATDASAAGGSFSESDEGPSPPLYKLKAQQDWEHQQSPSKLARAATVHRNKAWAEASRKQRVSILRLRARPRTSVLLTHPPFAHARTHFRFADARIRQQAKPFDTAAAACAVGRLPPDASRLAVLVRARATARPLSQRRLTVRAHMHARRRNATATFSRPVRSRWR